MEYKECKDRERETERERRNNVFQHALSLADSSRFQLAKNYTSIVQAEELTRFACVASSPLCFYVLCSLLDFRLFATASLLQVLQCANVTVRFLDECLQ